MSKQGHNGGSGRVGTSGITRRSFGKTIAGSAAALSVGASFRPLFAQSPKRGGKISIAFIGSPNKLDPHIAAGSEERALPPSGYHRPGLVDGNLPPQPEPAERRGSVSRSTERTLLPPKGVKF